MLSPMLDIPIKSPGAVKQISPAEYNVINIIYNVYSSVIGASITVTPALPFESGAGCRVIMCDRYVGTGNIQLNPVLGPQL